MSAPTLNVNGVCFQCTGKFDNDVFSYCEACNRFFYNEACFDRHKEDVCKKIKYVKSVIQRLWRIIKERSVMIA